MSRRDPRVVLREVRDHALEAVTLLGDRTLEDLRSQRIWSWR